MYRVRGMGVAVSVIGQHLKLPASKIYGVATFYTQFRFQPKHTGHGGTETVRFHFRPQVGGHLFGG